jgi:threonine dehydrogenase-like Zn-dependent dehydrogenase
MATRHGVETIDFGAVDDLTEILREATDGRGVDSAIDAVGMEADAGPIGRALQATKLLPDRLGALVTAGRSLRRGGTLSISGVYVGAFPLLPLGELFDRQITIRMGQANVRRWTDDLLPLLSDDDPLGTEDLTTHTLPLERAPFGYESFQKKLDGCIKVVLQPASG